MKSLLYFSITIPAFFLTVAMATSAFAKDVVAVLKLQEKIPMEALATDVQDPTSTRFNKFFTPEEIRDLSGPDDSTYNEFIAQLKKEGFKIIKESPTHLWVTISADSKIYDHAFNTQVQLFSSGFHMNAVAPNFSAHSLVESISGLDNSRKMIPHMRRQSISEAAKSDYPNGVPQSTIKSAYGFDPIYKSGISGAGESIAVATYSGFHIANARKFYKSSKLLPLPIIDQVKFNGTPKYDENSAVETDLDAEFTGMIAPGANIHVFASALNSDVGELSMFTAILDDNRSKVVNYSWGTCEKNVTSQHSEDMKKVLARAVAQGINIFVASGDNGSDGCGDKSIVVDFPSASPYVVAVGGTTFQGNNTAPAEIAWSGSGGGISSLFDLPVWQSSFRAPYVRRSSPDVGFNADPASGEAIWSSDQGTQSWLVMGGTSMAAPQWAGFLALVNHARKAISKQPLGYLNPYIYGLTDLERARIFHDVTSGSNGAFNTGTSWDAVTGLGSMDASALLNYLLNQ